MARVRRALLIALVASSIFCLAAWIPLLACPAPLLRLFVGRDPRVAALGPHAVRAFFLLLPVVGAQVVGAGYFQAVGKAGVSFFANLLRQVFILVPLLLLLPLRFGLDGVWMAGPISDALSVIITLALLSPELRRLAAAEAHSAPRPDGVLPGPTTAGFE
jgi:Na+-driven multidrug efflux pump